MEKSECGPSAIERAFKIRFGLKMCLIATSALLLTAIFVYYAASRELGSNYSEVIYAIADLKVKVLPLVFASFYTAGILAFATVAIAVISVFFSHSIAGPVYRIERSLEAIASGDLTVKTKLRSGDQLVPVAEDLNEMVRALNHRVKEMHETLDGIHEGAEGISELLYEKDLAARRIEQKAEEIMEGVQRLKNSSAVLSVKEP